MTTTLQAFRIIAAYFISVTIWSLFNIHGFALTLRQAGGQAAAQWRGLRRGIAYDETFAVRLPFHGRWKVVNGGVDQQTSHSWGLISQRYAYDFVIVDEATGLTYRGDPRQPANYLAFGQPVLAAADGIVVAMRNDIRDDPRAGTGWIDVTTPDLRGNYVIIKHHEHAYTLYAHLQQGSVCVNTGETVRAGQPIGACGNSGHSSEPHLHVQLQDRADFFTAIGLPIAFRHVLRSDHNGTTCLAHGFIQREQTVEPAPAGCPAQAVETVTVAKPTVGEFISGIVTFGLVVLGFFAIIARIIEAMI
ncbi:hypothetical protein A6A03_16270 [Chloroflexus islandicus]|uniref:M23ase beta-sheet core domain-containing protein n=1 Tax=Chloroflexus islandicus TaxID=1707952 RepID=A0A178M9K7_9CHLR|nr:M23 family metallopeptidase [Chloroflexus islandicus]OAN44574.1 hypothetical protein A6A03_16270 [Chloroflexus islandicus]